MLRDLYHKVLCLELYFVFLKTMPKALDGYQPIWTANMAKYCLYLLLFYDSPTFVILFSSYFGRQ